MLPHYHCLKGHPRPAGYRAFFLRDSEGLLYNPFVSTKGDQHGNRWTDDLQCVTSWLII